MKLSAFAAPILLVSGLSLSAWSAPRGPSLSHWQKVELVEAYQYGGYLALSATGTGSYRMEKLND